MPSPFSATRWVIVGTFAMRFLAFFGQVLILRLVSKEIFGTYRAILDMPIMLLPLLPMGFDQLLIRENKRARRYAVALAWTLAVWALLLAGGTALVALALAGEMGLAERFAAQGVDWRAALMLIPIFIVMATKISARSLLAARLDFRTISLGEFGNGILTYFGGALAVWFSPTVWALLGAFLLGELFECVWMYRRQRFRPMAILQPRRLATWRTLFRRHRKFCLTNTADLTLNNVGSLIPGPLIAVLISVEANAEFAASRILIQLPILLLVGAVWRVAFPTISGVDEKTLHSRCLRIIGTTAAFVAPGVIWLALFAPQTASILGGERYLPAAALVPWMALYMIMTAVYSPISSLDMVRDRPEVGLYWNLVHTAARVVVIWVFAERGLLWTIAAMSVTSAVLWVVWVAMLGWLLRAPAGDYVGAVVKFAPLWAVLGVAFWLCTFAEGPWYFLPLFLSAIPGIAYLAVVMRFFPQEAEMAWRLAGRGNKEANAYSISR